MGNIWSFAHESTVPCPTGDGICVSMKHELVIVGCYWTNVLKAYSLVDGSLVRTIGDKGRDKGQFMFHIGGLCVSPDGDSVLVAEDQNGRVQQISILDGSWIRFVGEYLLRTPACLDCNSNVIVVSESNPQDCINVFSWVSGGLKARFCSFGCGPNQLNDPRGIRLLGDGSGLVVADRYNYRLCVFTLTGEFLTAMGSIKDGVRYPWDVVECVSTNSFIVTCDEEYELTEFSRDGTALTTERIAGFEGYGTLAALPDGGIIVRECYGERFHVFRTKQLRRDWVTICVKLALPHNVNSVN